MEDNYEQFFEQIYGVPPPPTDEDPYDQEWIAYQEELSCGSFEDMPF